MLMGYVVAYGAMEKGLNVTYLPAYGAEMRGGTANCTVTLSDEEIASPVASEPDILVAMNSPSLEKFEPIVREGGLVLLNSSLIAESVRRSDLTEVRVPTTELAREVGAERGSNMVMVGALVGKAGLLSLEETLRGMASATKGKERFYDLNRKAIERGLAFVRDGR